jgi:hypothetical protein
MSRTIVVGDVHGCRQELEDLLFKVGPVEGDRVVFVGDVVARGPDSGGVLALIRSIGATLVRGNHEEKLIRHHLAARDGLPPEPLGSVHQRASSELKEEDFRFLEATPLFHQVPEHELLVVHAGIAPGIPLEHQARSTLLTVRSVAPTGEPDSKAGGVPWASQHVGPPHVVFGHHAQHEPQLHPHATGIDTGCVYGGALTALVLRENERVPPVAERRDVLVSVPAQRTWFGDGNR